MPRDELDLPRKKKTKTQGSFPNVSQSSIFNLKGLVAEHQNTFNREGKQAVKGQPKSGVKDMSRDKFSRPSPGIVKRMAHEARNELKTNGGRGVLADTESREAEERRAAIMRVKAEKYAALRRGDYGALTDKELAECAVDFERKWQEGDAWSDHDSDEDESAKVPEDLRIREDEGDEYEQIEYVDELGRTRKGTRREAREAETARRNGEGSSRGPNTVEGSVGALNADRPDAPEIGAAHAEVMQSNVIYGPQSFFPVYEPTQEDLIERIKAAQGPAETDHYDASKDVRDRAAGAYQFSQDETVRAQQMEALKRQREETEAARQASSSRTELTAAQESKKRVLEERRALIEAKRRKVLSGRVAVKPIESGADDAGAKSVR